MHCLCPCGLTVKESCCFAKLEAYVARLEENCHEIPKPAFFTFSLGAIFLTMWVHRGLPNSWQSTVLGQSYPLLLEKSSAWRPVLSLKYKKLSKVKFLHAVNFHLHPNGELASVQHLAGVPRCLQPCVTYKPHCVQFFTNFTGHCVTRAAGSWDLRVSCKALGGQECGCFQPLQTHCASLPSQSLCA